MGFRRGLTTEHASAIIDSFGKLRGGLLDEAESISGSAVGFGLP